MNNNENLACRVCGLIQCEEPWGEDGKIPNYAICACCGTEFGYEDYTKESVLIQRKKWLDAGGGWLELKDKPNNWNINEQLKNIPIDYK